MNPMTMMLAGPYSVYRAAKAVYNIKKGNAGKGENDLRPKDFALTTDNMQAKGKAAIDFVSNLLQKEERGPVKYQPAEEVEDPTVEEPPRFDPKNVPPTPKPQIPDPSTPAGFIPKREAIASAMRWAGASLESGKLIGGRFRDYGTEGRDVVVGMRPVKAFGG
jgi:hypothetical protein